MTEIVSVNPFRCRMWNMHDRMECNVSEENCRAEIDSFLRHGQLVPALGRKLCNDPDHDVELIYGARRLFVARHLNKQLLIELRNLSNQEAMVAMDIENRHRMDISPYERGLSYARWLRGGYFESQEDIARALKISCSQVSRLLKLARLPAVIVNAFGSVLNIREGWGLALMEALDDPSRREATVRTARDISARSQRPTAAEIYSALLAASVPGRKPKSRSRDTIVKDAVGHPLFRVKHRQQSVALVVPREKLSVEILERMCASVGTILQHRTTDQHADAVSFERACETGIEQIPRIQRSERVDSHVRCAERVESGSDRVQSRGRSS